MAPAKARRIVIVVSPQVPEEPQAPRRGNRKLIGLARQKPLHEERSKGALTDVMSIFFEPVFHSFCERVESSDPTLCSLCIELSPRRMKQVCTMDSVNC